MLNEKNTDSIPGLYIPYAKMVVGSVIIAFPRLASFCVGHINIPILHLSSIVQNGIYWSTAGALYLVWTIYSNGPYMNKQDRIEKRYNREDISFFSNGAGKILILSKTGDVKYQVIAIPYYSSLDDSQPSQNKLLSQTANFSEGGIPAASCPKQKDAVPVDE